MNTLIIKDEAVSGKVLHEISLQFENEYITVEELIAKRIEMEVERYENDIIKYQKKGLVWPTDIERRLNNKSFDSKSLNNKKLKRIDVEKQIYVALDAFKKNGFFILIDDEQVDELSQKFLVDESTTVSFVKLTPLVGG